MFRKMDEMERSISLRAARWAWFYLVLCLVLWMFWGAFHGKSWNLPSILLSSQYLVFFIAQQIMTMKTGDGRARTNLLVFVLILFVSLTAGAFLIWVAR